jgi:hypothetical protein
MLAWLSSVHRSGRRSIICTAALGPCMPASPAFGRFLTETLHSQYDTVGTMSTTHAEILGHTNLSLYLTADV